VRYHHTMPGKPPEERVKVADEDVGLDLVREDDFLYGDEDAVDEDYDEEEDDLEEESKWRGWETESSGAAAERGRRADGSQQFQGHLLWRG